MNRRLVRSRTDRVIAGVAAGLARYLNADPALVRIAWALLIPLTGGAAFLAYIVGWIVVPEDAGVAPTASSSAGSDVEGTQPFAATSDAPAPTARDGGDNRAGLFVGIGLVLLGAWFLVRQYIDIDWSLVWPIALIAIGAVILVTTTRRRTDV
ncbi:MAG TPA: PspC domain-containing protein [Candidatus Limnocylindria bacterium]|nr:PspC domain-containing protein [Candidatus Limnocylindria bacterium]